MSRKYIDCREMPSENNCDLAMAGSDEHVLDAAVTHAVTAHGHEADQAEPQRRDPGCAGIADLALRPDREAPRSPHEPEGRHDLHTGRSPSEARG
jgi:hypothetical protein